MFTEYKTLPEDWVNADGTVGLHIQESRERGVYHITGSAFEELLTRAGFRPRITIRLMEETTE